MADIQQSTGTPTVTTRSVTLTGNGARVVLTATGPEVLSPEDGDTLQVAVMAARQHGVRNPGVNTVRGPMPVDSNGEYSDALAMGRGGRICGYQLIVELTEAP